MHFQSKSKLIRDLEIMEASGVKKIPIYLPWGVEYSGPRDLHPGLWMLDPGLCTLAPRTKAWAAWVQDPATLNPKS